MIADLDRLDASATGPTPPPKRGGGPRTPEAPGEAMPPPAGLPAPIAETSEAETSLPIEEPTLDEVSDILPPPTPRSSVKPSAPLDRRQRRALARRDRQAARSGGHGTFAASLR